MEEKDNTNTKQSKKEGKIYIVVFAITAILLIVTAIIIIYNATKKRQIEEEKVSYYTGQKQDKKVVEKIRNNDAYKRCKVYLGKIIENLNNKNYEYAYNRLYEEFKKEYFPTQELFEKYIKNYFPTEITFRYENFEKIGDIFVVKADILGVSDLDIERNRDDMYFVFKEYDFDDYVFSFSTVTLGEDIEIQAIKNTN